MKVVHVPFRRIVVDPSLARTATARVFEDHLTASIEAVGLVEPLKLAQRGTNYVVVDGVMRWRAISYIRERDPERFAYVPAYLVPYSDRFAIRFQTDIYQDLLPSQLAELVEHLNRSGDVTKKEIARFIGVSAATLRNYTGLWRLVQRRGLFRRVVDLMDVGLLPASNPYAWLRLTPGGIRRALEDSFSRGVHAEEWIEDQLAVARGGVVRRFSIEFVESATSDLPPACYREQEEVRANKRRLGLRRARKPGGAPGARSALGHLEAVRVTSRDPVLATAADSLKAFLG